MELNLSKREWEVSRLFSLGMFSKEVADTLFLSVRTIETHRKNISKKNKFIRNVADLVREFVLRFGDPREAVFVLVLLMVTVRTIYTLKL